MADKTRSKCEKDLTQFSQSFPGWKDPVTFKIAMT